jgi:PleD family two-component response regulator
MANVVPFTRMGETTENRRGPERRRQPRGGRRGDDPAGFAPLVLLVGDDATVVEGSEAVLAKLHFGVTVSETVDEALRVLTSLRPDIVVASPTDAPRIRMEVPEHLPVLVMTEEMRENREALVEGIRQLLRSNAV